MTPALYLVVVSFALAGLAALCWWWWRRRERGVVGAASQAGRTVRVGALGSKVSLRYAWARVRAGVARKERRAAIVSQAHLQSAEEVVQLMGNMKGGLMKLGQILSFVGDELPEEYRTLLASLQTQSPPMSFALTREQIERDLGRPLDELFREIDPEPLAAASIGQVHRARLAGDGREVAVKVQYPGVADAIEADLANASFLYAAMGMTSPNLDSAALAEELRDRLREELDYRREAASMRAFAEAYRGHPWIHVPEVIDSHSGARVLTAELVEGHDFAWLERQPQSLKDHVAEVMWRFVFGSITRLHVFNGDPHPGNYLFHDDGRVTFLDFGCVRYFEDERMPEWRSLIRSHLESNLPAFRRHVETLGFVSPQSRIPTELWYEYFGYFYEPFSRDRRYTFTTEYTSRSLRMVFDRSHPRFGPVMKEANMPRDFLLVNRIQWGLYAILARLQATGNWHRIHRELYYGDAASTAVGRDDAEFEASWRRARGLSPGASVRLAPDGLRVARAA